MKSFQRKSQFSKEFLSETSESEPPLIAPAVHYYHYYFWLAERRPPNQINHLLHSFLSHCRPTLRRSWVGQKKNCLSVTSLFHYTTGVQPGRKEERLFAVLSRTPQRKKKSTLNYYCSRYNNNNINNNNKADWLDRHVTELQKDDMDLSNLTLTGHSF